MAYRQPPNGYSGDDRDMGRDDRSDRMDKHNTHLIEHLATFTVTPETGINYPADGMRRLLQLEKSNGIWSQKMLLCLDHSWVLIMDYETGTEMERFPANSIQEPTPFMSNDPMEMYNNILVFIVTNSNPNHPPEMHIFQCQRISAQDLAEDLKQLRSGKTLTRTHRSTIPPPTHKPPQNIINASREHNSRDYHGSDSELTANNDDSSSTTSEKYERDVSVLNHCFDDIEKFIAKLQHIDAAKTELARRQKNRKSKKPHSGDGMLSMRTKSPPPKEFVDIFQKFKLSFNLLAKLKMHIHDPNAPELVHFLFTPLALIVESSQVTYYDQQIAHNVVAPLLTREAVNLLMNCVTSKETELWHSLGPAWQIPRDQYKAAVPPYHPTFLDGFSPEYPIVDELDPSMDNKNFGDNLDGQYSSDYHDYPQSHQDNALMFENDHTHLPPTMGDSIRSDISVDSIETKGMEDRGFGRNQESFLEELQARGANIVCVTYPRTANNDKELTVVRGEILEILDDTRKWWKAKNSKGQVAHVPHTIVTPNINHNPLYAQQYRKRPESPNHHDGHGSNVHDHHINNMSPSKNSAEKIRNEHIDSKPPQPPSAMFNRPLPPPISTMPPPPPPPGAGPPPPPPPMSGAPPPPPPPGNMPISSVRPASQPPQPPTTPSSTLKRSPSVRSSYYEELATVITTVKDRQRKKRIEIKQTPEIYIYSKSTPAEVQEWLKKKGFDHNKCERISDMNGQNLFDFQKVELVQIFGDKEGKRLYSQLSIQKSISGYKTTSTTELQSFLAKARQKVEPGD